MFAPAHNLDPLQIVHGIRNDRYDCPDLATLDQHINYLRRRIAGLDSRFPNVADQVATTDRLLDRRSGSPCRSSIARHLPGACHHERPVLRSVRALMDEPLRPPLTWVELRGIEPLTYSMRTSRATNCATAPMPPSGTAKP